MSDINLREYLQRLDRLVQEGSADEVLWHARHILQYYPKNVSAYRHIGRALLMLGRWDDANAALRRVLSVVPNDALAHQMLSEISQHRQQADQAIWHMERAFEQDPSNTIVMGELQRLYRQYRNIANPRLQLTTAAVARQNIRSGELDRAIETLRASLARSSGRADLRLLLAEALWQRGEVVDAAETAMDVLHAYPDSLTANRMLAELWLSEGRPSDAQQFINRLEAIDPYLALELVQKQAIADDTFTLPELDYQSSAQAAMMGQSPDWLQGFGAPPAEPEPQPESERPTTLMIDDMFSDMGETGAVAVAPAEQDWLNELDAIELNYKVNTGALQSTTSPLAGDTPAEDDLPDFTDLVDDATVAEWATQSFDTPAQDDPMAWMTASQDDLDDIEHVEADPLAWMKNSGVEVTEAPAAPASTDHDDAPLEAEDSDPLGWLGGYHTEVMGVYEEEPAAAAPPLHDLSVRDTDEVMTTTFETAPTPTDALDFDEELPFPELDDILDVPRGNADVDRPTIPVTMPLPNRFIEDEPQAEPVVDEWELNQQLLDESLGLEELVNPTYETEADPIDLLQPLNDVLLPKTAPLPAMSDEDWEALNAPPAPPLQTDREMIMPDDNAPNLDWLNDDEEPKGEGENESSTGATGMLDWLAQAAQEAETSDTPPEAAGTDSASTGSTGMLNWLSGSDNPAYDVPAPEEPPQPSTGSTGMINWLSQNRPLPATLPLGSEESDAPPADDMGWLNELEVEDDLPATPVAPSGSGATEMLGWLGESDTDEVLTDAPVEPAAADDAWLQSLYADEPAAEAPAPQAQWDAELGLDESEQAQAEAAAEPAEALADWLSETNIPSLSEDAPTTEAEVVSPEAALQDWLAETADDAAAEPVAEASLEAVASNDWLADDFDSEQPAAALEIEPPQEPALDFFSLEGATGSLDGEPVEPTFVAATEPAQEGDAADDFDWFSDAAISESTPLTEPLTADEEAEAWFAQTSPTTEFGLDEEFELAEAQAEDAPVAIEQQDAYADVLLDPAEAQALPDWMNDVVAEPAADAAEAPIESYTPADVSAVIDAYESDLTQDETAAEPDPDAFADEEEAEAEPQDSPEWAQSVAATAVLSSTALLHDDGQDNEPDSVIESIDDFADDNEWDLAEVEAAPIAELDRLEADAYDALDESAVSESGEVVIEAAENAPDWLNAMVPGLDIDYTASEDEPLETEYLEESTASTPAIPENFGWLNEIVDEETRADEPAPAVAARAPRFVFSRPPAWLRRLWENRVEPAANDDDLPEWLR
jgi:Flp pilus assembly protein TadD